MVNTITLIGHVGADPDVRALETGAKVARIRLATTERYKAKDGTPIEHTEWHTVEAWRGLADIADRYIRKGSQLYVCGAMQYREYTDREGVTRIAATVRADVIKLLGRRGEATQEQAGPGTAQPAPMPPMPDKDVDDLPF